MLKHGSDEALLLVAMPDDGGDIDAREVSGGWEGIGFGHRSHPNVGARPMAQRLPTALPRAPGVSPSLCGQYEICMYTL